jgi:hypothetical protein
MSENIVKYESQDIAIVPDTQNVFQDKEKFDQALRGAMALAKSTIVPQTYQGKPENCFIAIDMANRIGISPLVVMQNLYVVQGKPSWSGQACKMLIENSKKFEEINHVYTGEKGKDSWGCYVQAKRKSDGQIVKGAEVTIEMAKKEGWYSKSGSKWQTMPELMLSYRASAFFARVHTPESLMGFQMAEEVEDTAKEKIVVEDVL